MTSSKFNNQLLKITPDLQRYALKLTRNSDDAFDLVQDTYLKAIINQDKLIKHSSLKYFVIKIMKNIFFSNYRYINIHNPSIDKNQNIYAFNCKDPFPSPEEMYSEIEIKKAINSLSPRLRIAFKMYIEGYKHKEIAKELQIKEVTSRSRIDDAKRKLKLIIK